ncbi:hypothetical protein SCP_0705760 [Sparassis crispa]|uniref:Uncharacterized protein n=1 Tax=Sparassis crispa TaxID=139825 RepID=A0A401GT89_9APHY|nr:hypothetical protein SCP_0705760 [Sparassis crispa]GBE85389.1 hypothetical protein SCP_0705760 [Sparassis crispa]
MLSSTSSHTEEESLLEPENLSSPGIHIPPVFCAFLETFEASSQYSSPEDPTMHHYHSCLLELSRVCELLAFKLADQTHNLNTLGLLYSVEISKGISLLQSILPPAFNQLTELQSGINREHAVGVVLAAEEHAPARENIVAVAEGDNVAAVAEGDIVAEKDLIPQVDAVAKEDSIEEEETKAIALAPILHLLPATPPRPSGWFTPVPTSCPEEIELCISAHSTPSASSPFTVIPTSDPLEQTLTFFDYID